tara:strand:+ start:228 stop:815 length:588 start_codon:yes stop_codon:yes gene_type:complete
MLNNDDRIAYQQGMILEAKRETERLRVELARVRSNGLNSLAYAKDHLAANRSEGAYCPCCDQYVREYKRKLNSEITRFIIWLVRHCPEGGWLHVNEWRDYTNARLLGGDYGKASHWGFCERKPNDDDAKKSSGFWKPTALGVEFARNNRPAPLYVHLYNNRPTEFSGELAFASDCLGLKFDYAELMGVEWEGAEA